MNDGFRVARRPQRVTALQKHLSQLAIVVDLAVEHDPDRAILVADWLMTAVDIDDAEASHAEADAGAHVDAFFVGPAVDQHLTHRPDFAFEDRFAVEANDSSNTTHDGHL